METFYNQPEEFYNFNPNKYIDDSIIHPILFFPENSTPNKKSIYESNCLEFWKFITDEIVPGIEKNRYMISSHGNTWDTVFMKRITYSCSKGNGFYVTMTLHLEQGGHVTLKLHRLVMMLFNPIPNPQEYQVNHKDTVHRHNNISNLEWCDDAYNRYHGILNGAGSNIFGDQIVVLYPYEIDMIKEMKQQGYSNPYIADYLNSKRYSGVHRKLIERISLGKI